MIRMFQVSNADHAKGYFKTSLKRADYYIEEQEHAGKFHGKIAKRLGLENAQVTPQVFDRLCDNRHPFLAETLTPRTVDHRRVGYDISFHCPKSVSILHALGKDERVRQAFEKSVSETMTEMQKDMQTRVRVDGQYHDRDTGEIIWADFVHETARPVEGHPPDPHLHAHCFTFNVTYDGIEQRYKAGQFHNIKLDMPYYQARFQKRLADQLSSHGYGIRKTESAFEVAVIPQQAIDYFSKRTDHIGRVAKQEGIIDPQELDQLGARTRSKKDSSLTLPELRNAWRKNLKTQGLDATIKEERSTAKEHITVKGCLDHTLDHAYARASVKRERQLQATAYMHAIDDQRIGMDELDNGLESDDRLFKIQDGKHTLCTTDLVHNEERQMVTTAIQGKGQLRPLIPHDQIISDKGLDEDKQKALTHILRSTDRLTMIRGGAGTGKTTLIKTAMQEIEKTGKDVFVYAPTSNASRDVLRAEGFENADTVASLLKNKTHHNKMRNQVIWIDEAGMLGTKDMKQVQELSNSLNARLILSGDPKQHTAVDRGDAMINLQQVAKMPYVSLTTIYRQKVDTYKQVVDVISKGNIKQGFDRLDKMKAIRQFKPKDLNDTLTKDYLKAIKDKKSVLVVSPTNQQADQTTHAIRDALQKNGYLGKRKKTYTVYKNLHLTNAQKQDDRLYKQGHVIQLHQNIVGAKRSEKLSVIEATNNHVTAQLFPGNTVAIPFDRSKDYDVYRTKQIDLSKGDLIKITKNGFDQNGKRLDNGTVLQVKGFTKNREIIASKHSKAKTQNVIIDPQHGNFDYAYCMTSHASQGRTVDKVMIVQPSNTFPATNMKQFYVSVSRARDEVIIYTDDKQALLHHASKKGDRQHALDIKPLDPYELSLENQKDKTKARTLTQNTPEIDYDDEPRH